MSNAVAQQAKKQEHTPIHDISLSQPVKVESEPEKTEQNQKRNRRKKRKNKKAKAHSPEYYEEIRLEKIYHKREQHWNNRFANDSIPDIFRLKSRGRKKASLFGRNKSPLQSVYVQKQVNRHKLPNLTVKQKMHVAKNTTKSFKVRTINSKKEEKQIPSKDPQNDLKISQKQGRPPRPKKQTQKQRFIGELTAKDEQLKLEKSYKEMLLNLNDLLIEKKNKELRSLLQGELNSITLKNSSYDKIVLQIIDRRNKLNEIKQGKQIDLSMVKKFQIVSLGLVEDILKYKDKWSNVYKNHLSIDKNITFDYLDHNYLLEMNKEVEFCKINDVADPFLVSKAYQFEKKKQGKLDQAHTLERKQMMLKIRACELLLIEEQLRMG